MQSELVTPAVDSSRGDRTISRSASSDGREERRPSNRGGGLGAERTRKRDPSREPCRQVKETHRLIVAIDLFCPGPGLRRRKRRPTHNLLVSSRSLENDSPRVPDESAPTG